jgi:hypothetical protein
LRSAPLRSNRSPRLRRVQNQTQVLKATASQINNPWQIFVFNAEFYKLDKLSARFIF